MVAPDVVRVLLLHRGVHAVAQKIASHSLGSEGAGGAVTEPDFDVARYPDTAIAGTSPAEVERARADVFAHYADARADVHAQIGERSHGVVEDGEQRQEDLSLRAKRRKKKAPLRECKPTTVEELKK